MDNNKSGNNFFGGFLLGVLVGAAVVFLMGTKKGKKIWKAISEKGIDNISNLLDTANKSVDLDEIENENEPSLKPMSKKIEPKEKIESFAQGEYAQQEKIIEDKPKVRRFFRGIQRHLN